MHRASMGSTNKTMIEIRERLTRGESLDFISLKTGVSAENIRIIFRLKK